MRYFSNTILLLASLLAAACTSSTGGNTEDCYSPTQNLDIAYDDGAVGCTCTDGAEAQCLPDSTGRKVALVCENGRWQAVNDGPCGL